MSSSGRISRASSRDIFETSENQNDNEANQQALLVEWIISLLPNLQLPKKASSEELRACLLDGTVLLQILRRLRPRSANEIGVDSLHSSASPSENIERFLESMDELEVPRFEIADLEKGSMKAVVDCLLALRGKYMHGGDKFFAKRIITKNNGAVEDASLSSPTYGDKNRRVLSESKFQQTFKSPAVTGINAFPRKLTPITVLGETSTALMYHPGQKFQDVFQLKQTRCTDLSAAKISEMMKPNSLDNAPTQSLLSVVSGILDESVERKNGEIPHRVACLLRKVVQEIERRILTQGEHLRTQNNLFKAREEKYLSRIRLLETLASGMGEASKVGMDNNQKTKDECSKKEDKKNVNDEEIAKLVKERDEKDSELQMLRQESDQKDFELQSLRQESDKKDSELQSLRHGRDQKDSELQSLRHGQDQKDSELQSLRQELDQRNSELQSLRQELDQRNSELQSLKQELDLVKKKQELLCSQIETESQNAKAFLERRVEELERLFEDERNKTKNLETLVNSKRKNEVLLKNFVNGQFGTLKELRLSSASIKHEVTTTTKNSSEELKQLGAKIKALIDSTENYHLLLAENRKMFNELQELKGNIRVYCRIRPFLKGQSAKETTIEHIGDNGELVIANRSKPGKEGHRLFRFNKVYGPDSTQAEVFSDTQPLVRSILDGYNVCIFAYGQTGSGKTYTMTGPNGATEEEWGVNYRALNDLFKISKNRKSSYTYDVGVQMVEIYNEQVRDLLGSGGPKKLGILSSSHSNGVAVPDATMQPVSSTADVLELMNIGLNKRSVSATAMNERSSRSHSVVSIHVRGKDLHTGATLYGNLHLVDLAGSERVDRSEVTGDRLKEAQHINKSLSALGDVIFALAQKNAHVPYRNSKLTQLLQSSLGGQAKTLMFVQINPDVSSHSESLSTLKFAERVSGIELGAAKSTKEGKDIRELMEQVASLRDTITKKDEEIDRLQLLKDLKYTYSSGAQTPNNELA